MFRRFKKFPHVTLFLLLLALYGVQSHAAPGNDLESELNRQFKDRVLLLLHPSPDQSLRFAADGTLSDARPGAPWTVFGGVRIRKIHLHSDRLQLEGERVFFRFDSSGPVPFDFKLLKNRRDPPCQPAVEVEIKLDQPLDSIDRAQNLLGKVFAFAKEDFLASLPQYWRAYVAQNLDIDAAKPGDLLYKPHPVARGIQPLGAASSAHDDDLGSGIFKVGGEVKRPKATYTPEPQFSEAARYEKYQGVVVASIVVDKTGHIAQVKITRAVGFGLDDQAATGITMWRFDPALRNGEPVAVAMSVEVAFNLY